MRKKNLVSGSFTFHRNCHHDRRMVQVCQPLLILVFMSCFSPIVCENNPPTLSTVAIHKKIKLISKQCLKDWQMHCNTDILAASQEVVKCSWLDSTNSSFSWVLTSPKTETSSGRKDKTPHFTVPKTACHTARARYHCMIEDRASGH